MTENEALEEYCERFNYYSGLFSYEEVKELMECERKSLGFQRYLLSIAIQDLKKEMFNALPKWFKVFIKDK